MNTVPVCYPVFFLNLMFFYYRDNCNAEGEIDIEGTIILKLKFRKDVMCRWIQIAKA
jgi:hypothetical protein